VGGVVTAALPAGDYSLQGYETRIAIERKSLADFIGTVVHAQDRFARELSLLRSYPRAWIVVEASMRDVLEGAYESEVTPQALFAISASLQAVYNIEVQFAGDRETARAWVEELLTQYWKAH
jgi:ERCC4-type nuclease